MTACVDGDVGFRCYGGGDDDRRRRLEPFVSLLLSYKMKTVIYVPRAYKTWK